VRLDDATAEYVENVLKLGEFATRNDYIVWLITQHHRGHDAPMAELGETIANTIERFRKSIRGDIYSARKSAELSNAFLHALVKMMLVNFPEADAETKKIAVATAQKRYNRLLINAVSEYDTEKEQQKEELNGD
jgi:hypothetical protein